MPPSLDELRRFALRRSFGKATDLGRVVARLGFVQADPIRAPARAQDLILLQRVKQYRAGELERRYPTLDVEEDFFVNYGFVSRELYALMHPRAGFERETRARARLAADVFDFVRAHGEVHPNEVERHLGSGTERNYWGGSSRTTTRLLDALHYRGLLRVARRDGGIRVYAEARPRLEPSGDVRANVDALVDAAVRKYAPLPAASLVSLVSRLRYAAPQWTSELRAGLTRARERLASAHVDGLTWYWPKHERVDAPRAAREAEAERVRLLAPFDPVVWDRRRFEAFWSWRYRLEAYTPVAQRKLGYYALPLLWRGSVIGWGNLTSDGARLAPSFGYVAGKPPRDPVFRRALAEELARFERFLAPQTSRAVTDVW